MNKALVDLCESLTLKIKSSYESGVGLEEAERLAGEFLYAQMQISDSLKVSDLDARMKKTGVKAIKAAAYMTEATKGDKKPSDTFIQAVVDQDKNVIGSQDLLDSAESERDHLQNYMNIFKEAHIHFRGIAKGRFGD